MLTGLAVATIAGATWFTLFTADDGDDSAPSGEESTPPAGLDIAPQEVSSPLVVPIDDASEVMADVDDNSGESEALDILGLDEAGNQIPAADSVMGYRFTWSYGTDSSASVTVDTTTGNYQFESTDGNERRYVDDTSYSRQGDIAWVQTEGDEFASVQRLGFDGPILIDQVFDPLTAEYTALTTREADDGITLITAEVDAIGYSQAHPSEHAEWMASLGHPVAAVQPGEIVVVQAEIGADGSAITLMTVSTSTFATSYSLDEVFENAPIIEAPAL